MMFTTLDELLDRGLLGTIFIDNDEIFIYDETSEETVFKMHPQDALVEALEQLGFFVKYV